MLEDLSQTAWEMLLKMVDDELGRRQTYFGQSGPEVEAFMELAKLGLAESGNRWDTGPELFIGRATDAGRYLVGQGIAIRVQRINGEAAHGGNDGR